MSTYYQSPRLHLIHADVLEGLRALPDSSVHCVVTSPPYYALRDYEKAEGQLGLEATPELFIENMLNVFREVRRVLRDDGTCWVNIGDSYAGSGKGRNADGTHSVGGKQDTNLGSNEGLLTKVSIPEGLKALDLMGMPWRFALAMQQDGWHFRRDIIWAKPNPMPESVNGWRWERHRVLVKSAEADWRAESEAKGYAPTEASVNNKPGGNTGLHAAPKQKAEYKECPGCRECKSHDGLILRKASWRPTTSHEYLFMFSKAPQAYADREAVRERNRSGPSDMRKMAEQLPRIGGRTLDADDPLYKANRDTNIGQKRGVGEPNGRNLRSVWEIDDEGRTLEQWLIDSGHGALLDEFYSGDLGSVWQIATQALKFKHFASYPEELVEPCIKASTSAWGCCAQCGAPWAPVIEIRDPLNRLGESYHDHRDDLGVGQRGVPSAEGAPVHEVVDWRATCEHGAERVPCTVLDPFVGSGTTALVARKLGRAAVGIDLNSKYLDIVLTRLKIDKSREALNPDML